MKLWLWSRCVMVTAPVVYMLGFTLQGCTEDVCPTEEEKAEARKSGTELVESEDCVKRDRRKMEEAGEGGAPGKTPQFGECYDCCCGAGNKPPLEPDSP